MAAAVLAACLAGCAGPNPAYQAGQRDAPNAADDAADINPPSGPDGASDGARDQPAKPADAAVPEERADLDGDTAPPMDAETLGAPAGTCPQQDDLALCVRFEGALRDESQYSAVLTASGVAFAAGPTGMAGSFASSTRITVPENPIFDLQAVTLEAWVNPASTGRRMGILDNNGQYGLILLGSGRVMCTGAGAAPLSVNPVTVNVWTSVACTFEGGRVSVWVNGVLSTDAAAGTITNGNSSGLSIGWDGPDGAPFDGLIDNIRLWRTVRSPQQLCAAARNCP